MNHPTLKYRICFFFDLRFNGLCLHHLRASSSEEFNYTFPDLPFVVAAPHSLLLAGTLKYPDVAAVHDRNEVVLKRCPHTLHFLDNHKVTAPGYDPELEEGESGTLCSDPRF